MKKFLGIDRKVATT